MCLHCAPLHGDAAAAQEMQKAYTDAELAKVREWEKTWAGKKIDKTNVDQVAELMLSFVDIIKNPDKWGSSPEGFFFMIRPYRLYRSHPASSLPARPMQARPNWALTAQSKTWVNLQARLFMDPGEDGMKMAWNFETQNRGDAFTYRKNSPNVNPKNKTERLADQQYSEYYFVNRTELNPKPALPNNPKGYRRGMFLHLPAEFLDTRMYTLRYVDQKKEDDSYLWYSQFRRIRRMNTLSEPMRLTAPT